MWLLSSTAIVLAGAVALSKPILAADECGTGSSVVCDSGDPDYSTFFADGITYDPVADLTLIVASDVAIAPNSGVKGIFINSTGGIIDLTLEDGASITTANALAAIDIRNAYAVTIDAAGDITTSGVTGRGIFIYDIDADVDITVSGTVATSGTAIWTIKTGGDLAVTLSEGGSITSATYGVDVSGTNGDATITLSEGSSIETTGTAISIINHDEDITVRLNEDSSIETNGSDASGIHASGAEGRRQYHHGRGKLHHHEREFVRRREYYWNIL